ncbi:MAG: GPH family glycoside/pentoside/hexuronide:cation symporter [Gammaproteobacteria bacterium]|jgi:GPH family glycoside/pentoside/hexuronide:cation symporter
MSSIPDTRSALSTQLYYGCGAVAYGAKSNGFNYLLLFFYSQVVGLPAQWVSFGIFLALLVDAISDPLVGYFSDNLRTRWGRRHPLMYIAGLPAAIAYYYLWAPPDLDQQSLFIYFVTLAIVIRTLLTFYEIPSTSLVAEFTDDYDLRTRFLSFRHFFGWWGGLTMSVLVYLVFLPEDRGGLEYAEGWRNYGLAAAIIIGISIYVSAFGTHRHIPHLKKPPPPRNFRARTIVRELVDTFSNRAFLILFVAALFTAMAAGVNTSLGIYFGRHFWELTTQQIGLLQLPYFLSAVAALAITPMVSRRFGKKHVAIATSALTAILTPLPVLLRLFDWFPDNGTDTVFYSLMIFYTIDVTLMIMSGILVGSMIADVVEDSELVTGRRSEGSFFAASSFAQKAVNGLGVVVAGQILAWSEFPAEAKPGEVEPTVLSDLALAYVPALWSFYGVAIVLLCFYGITRERHLRNVEQLSRDRL